ncbi:MAG: S46 family peptidase, partial [Bacteroidales bacterium]|nr:S46 family peptidase [Bacteroidales bacterium]
MIRRKLLFIWIIAFVSFFPVFGDEGMWIPMLIEKLNIQEMQEKGLKLSAEDIYSVNKASMKDAVMIFGGGCTAELISAEGLLLTNHHCGYRSIQKHSTVEHDYLTNGFWAMSHKEELLNPGLKVTFLKWMEDVTGKSLEGINSGMSEKEREERISENNQKIITEAVNNSHFSAHIEPFFAGNQYFLFVEEVFRDVRFVGAPPSSIGKFGGDTDNWMWPRHTGDFSLFRIYANKNNEPAEFSPDNVPYEPVKFFPISLKGIHPDDFTMVFGYPGSTYEYVPSYHIKMLTQEVYPKLIDIRDKKLELMNADMSADPKVRIQYSSKYASVSNSWKRWIGEINGLDKLDAIAKKQAFENGFMAWVASDPASQKKYGTLLPDYRNVYNDLGRYRLARDYINEVFFRNGAELVSFSSKFANLIDLVENEDSPEKVSSAASQLISLTEGFFKDYNLSTDKKLFVALMKKCGENMPAEFQPSVFINIHSKFNDDYGKYMESV